MLMVGSRISANTQRFAAMYSTGAETHHIEWAREIDPI